MFEFNNETLRILEYSLPKELYTMVVILDKLNLERLLQIAINLNSTNKVMVDGIIGKGTLKALFNANPDSILHSIEELLVNSFSTKPNDGKVDVTEDDIQGLDNDKANTVDQKSVIMGYLANAEGTYIHRNKTESEYTTSFGIYKKSFPKSKPILYVDSLASKYGCDIDARDYRVARKEIKKLNSKLTVKEKTKIRDLAYEFYMKKFMDKKINNVIDQYNCENKAKFSLSYFSIAVNGGLGRSRKNIQKAINVLTRKRVVGVDGKIGPGTVGKFKGLLNKLLGKSKCNIVFDKLNQTFLIQMKLFYDHLISRNNAKYGRYKRGWYNRLKGLGLASV